MKIGISIVFIVIVVLFTSRIKINIPYLNKEPNSFKIKFCINIGLYLFGFLKIFGISLKENEIAFLWFKFSYPKMKIDSTSMKKVKEIYNPKLLQTLNIKLEKFNFSLKIGCEDMIITVFSVFMISTLLSILFAQNSKQINLKNCHYEIIPIYNVNCLSFQASTRISINFFNITKAIIYNMQNKELCKTYAATNNHGQFTTYKKQNSTG